MSRTSDAGTMTVTLPSVGSIELPPLDAEGLSYKDIAPFAAGEAAQLSIGGSQDFQASSATLLTPQAVAPIGVPPLARGEPLPLSWLAGDPQDTIGVIGYPVQAAPTSYDAVVHCEVPDTGSLTIAGSLTGLLDDSTSNQAVITVGRARQLTSRPDGHPEIVHISAGADAVVLVDYLP